MSAVAMSGSHGVPRDAAAAGPAPRTVVVTYGFWIFLLSDVVMFSAIFATYAVLVHASAGGPTGPQIVDQTSVAIETACLLGSSFSCGMMQLALKARNIAATNMAAAVTFFLGVAFLVLEMREFASLITRGATPERSAFLSAFFTLVGCHGAHVTVGLFWLVVMMAQVWTRGFHDRVMRRFLCFSLFWHALDIIWVALFSLVYLIGGR